MTVPDDAVDTQNASEPLDSDANASLTHEHAVTAAHALGAVVGHAAVGLLLEAFGETGGGTGRVVAVEALQLAEHGLAAHFVLVDHRPGIGGSTATRVADGKVGEGLFGLGQVVDLVASLFAAAAADAAGGIVQDAVAVFIVREHVGAAGLGHLCRAQCGSDASAAQDGQKFSTIHNRTLQLVGVLGRTRLVVKSTWAAARYLKDLYDIYQDWNLVLAAYNCGPGTINKAIRRAGGATDYWTIYNYLPKETRGYVPAFIAANYIMTYYCEHGICPMETQLPNATDTIHINKDLHLQQVAEVCNINLDQLRSLNPQYKKDIIPGNSELCALRLPNNFVSTFIDRQDSVFAYKPNEYLTKRKTVAIKETTSSRNRSSKGTLYHKIKQGDTLGGIAAKYHVSISQLRNLNGIKGNNIRAGRSLRIR